MLTLAKLKIARSLSEETTAFTADLTLDGKVFGYASNHGQGGPTDARFLPGLGDNVQLANAVRDAALAVIAGTWMEQYTTPTDNPYRLLEAAVDVLVDAAEREKEAKRVANWTAKQVTKLTTAGYHVAVVKTATATAVIPAQTPEALQEKLTAHLVKAGNPADAAITTHLPVGGA